MDDMLLAKFLNSASLLPSLLKELANQSFFNLNVSFTDGSYYLVLNCLSPAGFSNYQIDFLFDKLISLSVRGIDFKDNKIFIPFDL